MHKLRQQRSSLTVFRTPFCFATLSIPRFLCFRSYPPGFSLNFHIFWWSWLEFVFSLFQFQTWKLSIICQQISLSKIILNNYSLDKRKSKISQIRINILLFSVWETFKIRLSSFLGGSFFYPYSLLPTSLIKNSAISIPSQNNIHTHTKTWHLKLIDI